MIFKCLHKKFGLEKKLLTSLCTRKCVNYQTIKNYKHFYRGRGVGEMESLFANIDFFINAKQKKNLLYNIITKTGFEYLTISFKS